MNVLENIAKLCTTPMGVDRIRKNIGLGDVDVVEYCKSIIQNLNCVIYRQGKNWYCELDGERNPDLTKPYLDILAKIADSDGNRVVRIHALGAIKAGGLPLPQKALQL